MKRKLLFRLRPSPIFFRIAKNDGENSRTLSLFFYFSARIKQAGCVFRSHLSFICPEEQMSGLVNFEDEEEVKVYLENLGTEYSFQCYKEHDPDGCHRLADYLAGIKVNFEAAAKVLKENCENNLHSESCYKLGNYYLTGKGGLPRDVKTAYQCFLKSCEKGGKKSINACHSAGLLLQDGQVNGDEKPNVPLARDYYSKACDNDFAPSCFNLSTIYLQGAPGISKDMSQALQYSLKACDLGHLWACANASRMYKLGDGVEKNDAKAETLKNRAETLYKEQNMTVNTLTFGQ